MKGKTHERTHHTKNELFTSIPLKQDPTIRSHFKDEEIHFPNLKQSTSVDTFWMSGFLHHEKKTKERKVISNYHKVYHPVVLNMFPIIHSECNHILAILT